MKNHSTNFDRSKPPKPGSEKTVTFPEWIQRSLPNGLTCLIYENHDTELLDFRMVIRSGSSRDGQKYRLAYLTSKMLMQGTHSRSATDIAEQAERLGIDLHTGISADRITIYEDVMTKYIDEGLELFADVILNPSFPEKELSFLRGLSLSQLQASKADGSSLASKAFLKRVYETHPYGNPGDGTEESLNAITTQDLHTFYRQRFSPEHAFLIVAGDVDPDAIMRKLANAFGGWTSKPMNPERFALPRLNSQQQIILTHQEGAVQSTIYVGHLCIQRNHPDFMALHVTNMILGGYFGSRLNMNIREDKGFTYSIHSRLSLKVLSGDFYITLKVRNNATLLAIEEIQNEIKRLQTTEVSEEELQAAKQYMIGSFHIQNETAEAIASRILTQHFFGLPKDYYARYQESVQNISAGDVLRVAQEYMHPESFIYSIACNVYDIVGDMKSLGEVVCYDKEGNNMTIN